MFEYKRDLEISYYETQNRQNRQFALDHGMYVISSVPPEIQTAFESASLEVLSRLRQILGDDIVDRYLEANREQ